MMPEIQKAMKAFVNLRINDKEKAVNIRRYANVILKICCYLIGGTTHIICQLNRLWSIINFRKLLKS